MNELFLEIINTSILASLLVLVVLILRLMLKNAPKWICVLLWGIVAIRLICPFSVESSLSLIPDSIGSGELVSGWTDDYIGDIDIHYPDSAYYDAAIGAGREPIYDGEGGYYVVTKQDQLGEPSTIENTVVPILTVVWMAGMTAFALYTVISYLRLLRNVDTAVRYKGNVFQSENVVSPFVFGIIKPKIYLPFSINGQDLEHVIAHEQAHIRRKDHWWKPLGFLLLTIHWFNPLLWIAYVILCRDIELACDEKVIKELGNEQRADYMQALVSCSVNRRMIAACPLAFGEVGVKERVKSVMNYRKPAFWMIILAVMACIVVAICFLTNPSKEYQIKITIPAGSTQGFCYSDEEISPKGNTLALENGEGLGDTEVILKPIEVREEIVYEPTYMTPGMPVKLDVEKDAWFKIGVNMQNITAEDIDVYVSVRNVEVRIASEKNAESDNSVYGNAVAGLKDDDAYAFLVMNYDYHVMLASDLIYDEGTEKQASIYCDVYYYVDDEVKKLGTIMSDGTAYPITFTKDGIFTASGHKIEKYVISEEGTLSLEQGVYEQFDEAGNVQYTITIDEQENESTEQEYLEMAEEYSRSQIVHFSYGAVDSVNEYDGMEDDLDVQEPNMDSEEVQKELDRIITNVGLENAYPWNNTVNLPADADALIKMASDETGRFEIYGIKGEKYGTYGLLLNDWIGGEPNWNYAYVPWVYSGALSEQPILEPDGNGKYVFAYIYKYEDGVPHWKECILDCGYDTGHMELLSQAGESVGFEPEGLGEDDYSHEYYN